MCTVLRTTHGKGFLGITILIINPSTKVERPLYAGHQGPAVTERAPTPVSMDCML